VAAGGSQAIVDALAAVVTEHDGEIVTDQPVASLASLPPAAAVLLDVTPRQFLDLAGDRVTTRGMAPYRRFRYGPGSCKADYVLSGPMPWTAEAAHRAATVHVGGPFEDVARSEADAMAGHLSDKPFVLAVQPGVADPSRAPDGLHVLWAYCHVPHGSPVDASDRMERQFDRFAPGWRRLVVTKTVRTATDYEQYNANDVGGDIAGGSMGGLQLLFRPRFGLDPYATPVPGVWLCSSSTPPGGGVHGMSGWHAAGRVLAHAR
jgi:phytoene dehydrogenase-like protein